MSAARRIAALAARQHGVVARRQLTAMGFGPSAIDHWLNRGRLHLIYRGVYAVGHPAPAPRGRLLAAVLACGPGAVLSHRDAAELWGLWGSSSRQIDVTVASAGRRGRAGINLHQVGALDPADITTKDRIPVTTVARTLVDLAVTLKSRQLERALENAERQQIFDLTAIRQALARTPGRRGAKRLNEALETLDPEALHTRSTLERLFLGFCRDHGIPPPAVNVVVEGLTVDALWQAERLVVEVDSRAHHLTARQFEEDRRRDTLLHLAGYPVLRITHRRITDEPRTVARQLQTALAQRRSSAAPTMVSASIP